MTGLVTGDHGGDVAEIKRKELNDGSSELMFLLDGLLCDANRLLTELLDLPKPRPLSTK